MIIQTSSNIAHGSAITYASQQHTAAHHNNKMRAFVRHIHNSNVTAFTTLTAAAIAQEQPTFQAMAESQSFTNDSTTVRFCREGRPTEAIDMLHRTVHPLNPSAYVSLLKACSDRKATTQVFRMHVKCLTKYLNQMWRYVVP